MEVLQLEHGDNVGDVWEIRCGAGVLRSFQRSTSCS